MAKKKQQPAPVEESIEDKQERQRLELSILEMRLSIMFQKVTPENAPERIAAIQSSADISDDYRAWVVNVIRNMIKEPKPFPLDRGLLLEMRREVSEFVRESRQIKYDLDHPPVSLADVKDGIRKLMSQLFDNYVPYFDLNENREFTTSYVIFQLRLRSYRRDFGVFSDGVDGLSKAFNSLLLRIEQEINLLAAKENVRHIVADMRERLRDEASADVTDKACNTERTLSGGTAGAVETPKAKPEEQIPPEGFITEHAAEGTKINLYRWYSGNLTATDERTLDTAIERGDVWIQKLTRQRFRLFCKDAFRHEKTKERYQKSIK